ncbi:MAG: excisionase family DNA-binding protein [Pseudonocardia sp.]|nr:excisionase family DNA-binding protein [Pseudonocardia sp.]
MASWPPSTRTTPPATYTVVEVSALLNLALGGTYELLRDGTIPARRLGRRWIISRAAFHAWLDGATDSASTTRKAS